MTTIIAINDLCYSYPDGSLALKGLSLSLEENTRLGVVGPSGCGKSTLLSIVAGFTQPTSGEVTLPQNTEQAHGLTMMFQKDTLLPWLTVRENASLYFRFNRDRRKADTDAWIDELLGQVRLDRAADKYPYQLSGGMRRRAALVATVAPKPRVLLLDEPFSSLDEPTRIEIHKDVLRISNQFHIGVILVTHDLGEAVSLCDEVAILTNGPGRVASRHIVPFPRERDIEHLRETSDFLTTYGTLWHELGQQISRSREQDLTP